MALIKVLDSTSREPAWGPLNSRISSVGNGGVVERLRKPSYLAPTTLSTPTRRLERLSGDFRDEMPFRQLIDFVPGTFWCLVVELNHMAGGRRIPRFSACANDLVN